MSDSISAEVCVCACASTNAQEQHTSPCIITLSYLSEWNSELMSGQGERAGLSERDVEGQKGGGR